MTIPLESICEHEKKDIAPSDDPVCGLPDALACDSAMPMVLISFARNGKSDTSPDDPLLSA